jgi:hypothetical protein
MGKKADFIRMENCKKLSFGRKAGAEKNILSYKFSAKLS